MEVEQIIRLMESVAKYDISEFVYEEDGKNLTLKKENGIVRSATVMPEITPVEISKPNETAGNVVKAPLVGTFYAAPSPDAPPFVKVGDIVKKGQVLGIVEAMKLMNEIECEFDGILQSVKVEDGSLIEYGQDLFVIV